MTDAPQPSRPQQVTTAAVLAVAASTLAVANLFSTRDQLRTSTVREALGEQSGRGPLAQGGPGTVEVLEVLVLVSGALAATAGVLAVFAWQRHRAAWMAFFFVAGLMTFTWQVAGFVPLVVLGAGAGFFASRPARDWIAGRVPVARGRQVLLTEQGPPEGVGGSGERPQPGPWPGQFGGGPDPVPQGPAGTSDPPPVYGPWHGGSQPAGQQGQQSGVPQSGGYPAGATGAYAASYPTAHQGSGWPAPGRDPEKRPGTVTAACVITWISAGLVGLICGLVALVVSANRDALVRELRRQVGAADVQVTTDQALAATWAIVGIGLVWCLLAVVLAVLAFRRSRAGRIGLVISAALTVLVSLVAVLSFVSVLPLLLGVAVIVLLFTGGANDWYARRATGSYGGPSSGPSYGPSSGPSYGQPQDQQPYGQPPPPPPGRSGPW